MINKKMVLVYFACALFLAVPSYAAKGTACSLRSGGHEKCNGSYTAYGSTTVEAQKNVREMCNNAISGNKFNCYCYSSSCWATEVDYDFEQDASCTGECQYFCTKELFTEKVNEFSSQKCKDYNGSGSIIAGGYYQCTKNEKAHATVSGYGDKTYEAMQELSKQCKALVPSNCLGNLKGSWISSSNCK